MKLFISVFCLLLSITTAFGGGPAPANPRTMTFPSLDFQIPTAERVLLDCGMPVYLLRDSELPIITMSAMVHVGKVSEPATKAGLASLVGSVMRSGGAAGTAPEALDDELEFMASAVESSIGNELGTVSLTTLRKNFSRSLQLFSDVLLRPDFREKRVEIARKHAIEALRRQNDDPKEIAEREITRALYSGHPLGSTVTFDSLNSISRQDVVDFHRSYFRFDTMILTVSGDFERGEVLKELNRLFKGGEKSATSRRPVIPQPQQVFKEELLYGRKDVSQTVIRMGHLGLTKDSPDIYAVRMLDYILGGSFTSRLTMEVRTNQGLAYSVGSHFDIGRHFTGTFIAETETKAESTIKTVSLMKKIISEITTSPVTEEELNGAREYLINSFMFGFTSPATIVSQRARLEFYGYPEHYLEQYRNNIATVTRADILKAAKTYLHPDAFKVVIIGNADTFDQPLATLGTARQLDLTLVVPKP